MRSVWFDVVLAPRKAVDAAVIKQTATVAAKFRTGYRVAMVIVTTREAIVEGVLGQGSARL